ncbi:ankyrin repeat-containing domain protein [Lactarius pseudohatsudake]|nr:ankyrin repeat-containing domain protein [Lactarius pseudohatsudake]
MNTHSQNPLHLLSQYLNYFELFRGNELVSLERQFAQLLLECNVDTSARDKEQATPLHVASYYGHLRVAEVLLDHGFGVDSSDLKGHPGRVVRLAQRLLEHGADVNAQNKDRETPLHLASRLRLHEIARTLLENGADVNVKNSEGKSPLQLSSGRKGKAMKRLLLKYSAKST